MYSCRLCLRRSCRLRTSLLLFDEFSDKRRDGTSEFLFDGFDDALRLCSNLVHFFLRGLNVVVMLLSMLVLKTHAFGVGGQHCLVHFYGSCVRRLFGFSVAALFEEFVRQDSNAVFGLLLLVFDSFDFVS